MPDLPLSHYSTIKCGAYLIPTAFLFFPVKLFAWLLLTSRATLIIVRIGLFLSCNVVNGFDMKITMSNGIFEQTSNGTMAFLRYLIAFFEQASHESMAFLSSFNF